MILDSGLIFWATLYIHIADTSRTKGGRHH